MNIVSIETKVINLTLKEPFKIALGVIEALPTILIKIETSDGYTGYGESAPISFVTGETLESVEAAIKVMSQSLIGVDSSCIEKIHEIMNRIFRENKISASIKGN